LILVFSETNYLFIIRKKIWTSCFMLLWLAGAGQPAATISLDSPVSPPADSLSKIRIRNIVIAGNKKTKDYIILRELGFSTGDSVAAGRINEQLQKGRDQVYNTTLFIDVVVAPLFVSPADLDILVTVKERWYIFPIPWFQLADRSFNEWFVKYHGDLDRVNYGVRFLHYNISGRNDRLSLTLINGFSRTFAFEYRAPYTNPALSDGVMLGSGFSQTREIPYKTDYNNSLVYYKNDDFVKNEWYVSAAYSSRKAIRKRETFSLSFRHMRVADSLLLAAYNPAYFNSASASQDFIEIGYRLQLTDVDNILYPLKGNIASLSLVKRGLAIKGGINRLTARVTYNAYFSYRANWYSSLRLTAQAELPFHQPYVNQKALGYLDDYVRGDEYFAIDGVAFGLARFDVKKKLVQGSLPTFLKSASYRRIPFRIYGKIYCDAGYVYSEPQFDSKLGNKILYSGGLGVDIVTLYDFKLSIECSLNQLGQKGLFLHN
jgi:outer membrane protein assembly factor BamA